MSHRKPLAPNTAPVRLLAILCLWALAVGAQAQPVVELSFERMFGSQGTTLGKFSSPTGITFFDQDRVVVADRGNLILQTCTLDGNCTQLGNSIALFRNQPGTFDLPHGVEASPAGLVAVADEDNHAVQLCNLAGSCLYKGALNTENNPPSQSLGRWAFPGDVAFDSQGRVLGLDTGNDRVQVLRGEDLFVLDVFMTSGSNRGQLNGAKGIDVDAEDRVLFADTGNHRVQICDFQEACSAFGGLGSSLGRFDSPEGIEVDGLGRIWVADTGNDRIQVCDYQGRCSAFGKSGSDAFEFNTPTDVAVHPSGQVAVVDSANHRIQVFSTESSFRINAGLNDAWFNAETPGQGFFVTVWPDIEKIFLAHFTFDTHAVEEGAAAVVGGPGQRWVTAIGDYAGASAVLAAELTSGGIFDAVSPVPEQFQGYGSYSIVFRDCMNADLSYSFPGIGLAGDIALTRIVPDNQALCTALQAP